MANNTVSHAKTIPELLQKISRQSATATAYRQLMGNGDWQPITWETFCQKAVNLAAGLKSIGLRHGQAIGIMAPTCFAWEVSHHAILAAGGVVVGIDPNELPDNIEYIIKTANIQGLIIDKPERIQKLTRKMVADFAFIITFSSEQPAENLIPNAYRLEDLITGQNALSAIVNPESMATIIFTSGTTGTPKAIAYRHEQLLFACSGILSNYPDIDTNYRFACWLPLSNLFQRMVNLCALTQGAETYFVENPQQIITLLPQVSPHIFIAVPRFYEKLYEAFAAQLAKQPKPTQYLIRFCLNQAESSNFKGILFKRINRLLLKKFRAMFGDNILYLISGSAPMPLWLLKRYEAMGLLILEAYGMSENVTPIAANRRDDYKLGTVGKPLPGNRIKLASDGELLVKGFGVFNGYLNSDGQQNLDRDGYLMTGDYAEIDEHGFISLTGRKSEVFKTSTGRKIAPAAIESIINSTPGIDQSAVFGAGKKFLVAVVAIETRQQCTADDLKGEITELRAKLAKSMAELPSYQKPYGIVVSLNKFSLEKEEITANLKIKRKHIAKNYAGHLDRLYSELENPASDIHCSLLVTDPYTILIKTGAQ
jgi:long-chain acyl-CoA synthetase